MKPTKPEDRHQDYFEAILQLRDVPIEVTNFAKEEILKSKVHLAKTMHEKNGLDFYLADNKFAKRLGQQLQQRFGGIYNVSPSLFSRKDGRNIYRLTVLFRGMPYKKGDAVLFKGERYIVQRIGDVIVLGGQKKVQVKYKDLDYLKKAGEEEL